MYGNEPKLDWTEAQWDSVRNAVQEAARKARVAGSFLPLVGPLPASTTTVPALSMGLGTIQAQERVRGEAPLRLFVDERRVLHLATINADVYLRSSEASDPDLASAIAMFCRAADVLARVEDTIIFNGMTRTDDGAGSVTLPEPVNPVIYTVHGGDTNGGLLGAEGILTASGQKGSSAGNQIVEAVVKAIQDLESEGHYGPFACVLGHTLFSDANTPSDALVLPSDRITPFLNGPLLRSSSLPKEQGLVIALAGEPIELVVATDVTVKYLQLTVEPRYVFRVYERFALRVKQPGAVCKIMKS